MLPLARSYSPTVAARMLRWRDGFTLMELLISVFIIALLIALAVGAFDLVRQYAWKAQCATNLQQIAAAVHLYGEDNNGQFPRYETINPDGTRMWWFGNETTPPTTAEGQRQLNESQGPLYPYIQEVGTIQICPAFAYSSKAWKPKYTTTSWGYGYNWLLGGMIGGMPMTSAQLSSGEVMLMADCGQVNTFQAPASPKNPMMEEFYLIDSTDITFHFRHLGKANVLFVDGHVESLPPYPGTTNTIIPGQIFGRVTATGSSAMLK